MVKKRRIAPRKERATTVAAAQKKDYSALASTNDELQEKAERLMRNKARQDDKERKRDLADVERQRRERGVVGSVQPVQTPSFKAPKTKKEEPQAVLLEKGKAVKVEGGFKPRGDTSSDSSSEESSDGGTKNKKGKKGAIARKKNSAEEQEIFNAERQYKNQLFDAEFKQQLDELEHPATTLDQVKARHKQETNFAPIRLPLVEASVEQARSTFRTTALKDRETCLDELSKHKTDATWRRSDAMEMFLMKMGHSIADALFQPALTAGSQSKKKHEEGMERSRKAGKIRVYEDGSMDMIMDNGHVFDLREEEEAAYLNHKLMVDLEKDVAVSFKPYKADMVVTPKELVLEDEEDDGMMVE